MHQGEEMIDISFPFSERSGYGPPYTGMGSVIALPSVRPSIHACVVACIRIGVVACVRIGSIPGVGGIVRIGVSAGVSAGLQLVTWRPRERGVSGVRVWAMRRHDAAHQQSEQR